MKIAKTYIFLLRPCHRWVGYIKDYDGGTLMECYIHPSMDYLNVASIVAKQRAFIYKVMFPAACSLALFEHRL
jgi:hypothetical protein